MNFYEIKNKIEDFRYNYSLDEKLKYVKKKLDYSINKPRNLYNKISVKIVYLGQQNSFFTIIDNKYYFFKSYKKREEERFYAEIFDWSRTFPGLKDKKRNDDCDILTDKVCDIIDKLIYSSIEKKEDQYYKVGYKLIEEDIIYVIDDNKLFEIELCLKYKQI